MSLIYLHRDIYIQKKHAPTISSSTKKIVNLRSCALARGKDISPLGYSDIDSKEETKEGFHGNYIYIYKRNWIYQWAPGMNVMYRLSVCKYCKVHLATVGN